MMGDLQWKDDCLFAAKRVECNSEIKTIDFKSTCSCDYTFSDDQRILSCGVEITESAINQSTSSFQ